MATVTRHMEPHHGYIAWRAPSRREVTVLHSQIKNFCKAQELSREQKDARKRAQDSVTKVIMKLWPKVKVHLFGSSATGLEVASSDLDIVVDMTPTGLALPSSHVVGIPLDYKDEEAQRDYISSWIDKLHLKLEKYCLYRQEYVEVTKISSVRVPLVRVKTLWPASHTAVSSDVSFLSIFNRHSTGESVQMILQFLVEYEVLRPLYIVLKMFLKQIGLDQVYTGGIGSFCLILLVVSYLRKLPTGVNGRDLGALLLSFFKHYTETHDYLTDVVSVNHGHSSSKQDRGWVAHASPESLCVENPLDPSLDVAIGSYRSYMVRSKFAEARRVLVQNWGREDMLDRMMMVSGYYYQA